MLVDSPWLPNPAQIVERRDDADHIFTIQVKFSSPEVQEQYRFLPGQFNMVYVFGVGEIPISISSDPQTSPLLGHTIRVVGHVSRALASLSVGDTVGIRGPYGSHWPLAEAEGKDVIVVTGGLGCAPVVGVIQYLFQHRSSFGPIKIYHGIKTPRDLIYHEKFRQWRQQPDTQVFLSSDQPEKGWKYSLGVVTNLVDQQDLNPKNSLVMMCGPEIMMRFAIKSFLKKGFSAKQIYLSLERNMKCALGFCGHCQYGPKFICKDGPILRYDQIQEVFFVREV